MRPPTDLTATWTVPPPPPPPDARAHDFFNRMKALPTCVAANSMRNQAEIDEATAKAPNELYRYIFPNDPHPEAIDACKYTLPALKADGTAQVSQPTNKKVNLLLKVTRGILIVSWEVMFTKTWQAAFTPPAGEDWSGYKFKTWNLTHPDTKIYFESRNLWSKARGPQYVSVADVRNYDMGDALAPKLGVQEPVGYMPTGELALPNYGADTGGPGGFDVPVSKLLRFYKEVRIGVDASAFTSWNRWRPTASYIKPGGGELFPPWTGPIPPGRYNMLSEYVSGEDFDPICLLDRVPAVHKKDASGADEEIGKFYWEMNTSAHTERRIDAIAYGRNMVAWIAERGLADDPSPLSRPRR